MPRRRRVNGRRRAQRAPGARRARRPANGDPLNPYRGPARMGSFKRTPGTPGMLGSQSGVPSGNSLAIRKQHIRHGCALTNPFCPAARGWKIPDGCNGMSVGFQARQILSFAPNLNGNANAFYIFVPQLPYGYMGAASVSGGIYTMPGAFVTYQGLGILTTNGKNWRIVSMGIIFRVTSPANSSSGIMLLSSAPASPCVSNTTDFATGSTSYTETMSIPVTSGREVSWIAKRSGSQADRFQGQNATGSQPDGSWDMCVFEVLSSSAATQITADIYINVEVQLTAGNAIQTVVPPDPPKNAIALQARSATQSKLGSFIEGGINEAETFVTKAVEGVVSDVFSGGWSLATLFG